MISLAKLKENQNLVCFKDVATFIIEKSKTENEDANEGEVIIKTAAKLIKAEIVNQRFNAEDYSSKYDIEHHEKSLVPLLRLFYE